MKPIGIALALIVAVAACSSGTSAGVARRGEPQPPVNVLAGRVANSPAVRIVKPPPIGMQTPPGLSIHISGSHFVDGGGRAIRLLGVDRDGSEYMCIRRSNPGFFDGPADLASVQAIAAWHANAVRVPLNEDCWLGINGVPPSLSGAAYQQAVSAYVANLHAAGLYAILDLHWNAPGTHLAASQQVMADADHAPAFWASVATAFRNDPAVVFDLYNEPIINLGTPAGTDPWACWLSGCNASVLMDWQTGRTNLTWATAGMQSLVDAVRGTGAGQPILLGGIDYANDLSRLTSHLPNDPAGQLAASFHVYNWDPCRTQSCWASGAGVVAGRMPVVTGEFGENDCPSHGFYDGYLAWADAAGISYLGWAWVLYGTTCASGFMVIASYSGTPSAYGQSYHDHLVSLTG